uniref:Uncharacterized protein n=1 Tax=Lepeophtheirus salmonis TaxID=72036 RepID=A0A0K2TU77_LEPSM
MISFLNQIIFHSRANFWNALGRHPLLEAVGRTTQAGNTSEKHSVDILPQIYRSINFSNHQNPAFPYNSIQGDHVYLIKSKSNVIIIL